MLVRGAGDRARLVAEHSRPSDWSEGAHTTWPGEQLQANAPPSDSDFAAQVFKDPYLFDFLGTADPRREQEVELSLVAHIEKFLLELGAGFAFVGR